MLGLNVKKILEGVAPGLNIEEIAKESARVPKMLEALIEQSNNQGKALEYIIKKIEEIEKKTDKAQEILDKWDDLVEEDKKREPRTESS